MPRRDSSAPVVGRGAYPRWWERLRAVFGLAALNVALGIAVAIAFALIVVMVGFAFEVAISS